MTLRVAADSPQFVACMVYGGEERLRWIAIKAAIKGFRAIGHAVVEMWPLPEGSWMVKVRVA